MTSGPQNQTLYIKGIDDKIKKEELRRSLYCLFSRYGTVLDIVAMKTEKTRGQAFIVFDRIENSVVAMKELQGTLFYSRPLIIEYAKTKSNAVMIKEGTYRPFLTKQSTPLLSNQEDLTESDNMEEE